MSFANEVKKEILTAVETKSEQRAFTFGVLQSLASIILSSNGVKIQIKSPILVSTTFIFFISRYDVSLISSNVELLVLMILFTLF